jgi:hypothetical protein
MKVVSRFEASLLRILHFFLGHAPSQQALPLVQGRCTPPPCLSRVAVELVEDTLAKGCTLFLARTGGWRKGRFVRADRVADGRLWERTAPDGLGLKFSRAILDFLMWITARDPREEESTWSAPPAELTPADWLFFFLVYRAIRPEPDLVKALAGQVGLHQNALCRLAYPEEFPPAAVNFDLGYELWTHGVGGCILEALQPLLTERWFALESGKARMTDWNALQALGDAQERVLDGFLDAVERAQRLDLADFLLVATERLLTPGAAAHLWVSDAVRTGPPRMADRVNMQHAALALVRQVERFQDWERQARSVGYFDEGYQASQLTKENWERHGGDTLHSRAQAIIQELDPLRPAGPGEPGA